MGPESGTVLIAFSPELRHAVFNQTGKENEKAGRICPTARFHVNKNNVDNGVRFRYPIDY